MRPLIVPVVRGHRFGLPRRLAHYAQAVQTVAAAAVLLLAAGCGDESVAPPPVPAGDGVYWRLTLNHHAALLSTTSPYDTLQLIATARNFRGEPMENLPVPQFRSLNSDKVFVSADGLIVAGDTTATPVTIEATLTVNNTKHTDTIGVIVVDTATPTMLEQVSIHPIPPDSAKVAMSAGSFAPLSRPLPVYATAVGGHPFPIYRQDDLGMLPVHFTVADTTVVNLGTVPFGAPASITGLKAGHTKIIVNTTAFGVSQADTIDYRIGLPIFFQTPLDYFGMYGNETEFPNLDSPEIKIGVGGAVSWYILAQVTTSIQFADADLPNVAAPEPILPLLNAIDPFMGFYLCGTNDCANGGNLTIPGDTPFPASAGRYFPVAGTYEYRLQPGNQLGRIVVVDEQAEP